MKKLFLLDGSGYVFRAYYGLPELHDKDGHNVNAIFGFFRMLFRLREQKPDYFVIARDAPVKTVRKEMDENYKAKRIKMPDEFKRQMGMIKELVAQLKIPAEEIPWFEADDIIGTLAKSDTLQASSETQFGIQIVSSDKDLKQLVSEGKVTMYDAMKNITTTEKSFKEEYWFAPPLMVDYLALVWDSADNIPWVKWIGKKWAMKLIQERWDIDTIYKNIDKISWSLQTKLIEWKDEAYRCKTLTALMTVPGYETIDLAPWTMRLDFTEMKKILVDGFGFDSLGKVLDGLKKHYEAGEQLSLF